MSFLSAIFGRRGAGYLDDPADARDRALGELLGAVAGPVPPPSRLLPEVLPKNQAGTNSCTGQALAQAVRIAGLVRKQDPGDLSALFNYYCGRAEWGGQTEDGGSFLRTGCKALQRFGIPPESAWPFSALKRNARPGWRAFQLGYQRRGVRGYYRVSPSDLSGIRRAIGAGFPVVGGWLIDQAFIDHQGTTVIGPVTGKIVGGHAVVLDGYSDDGTFRLLNSWGQRWGSSGRARVNGDFVASGRDLWVIDVEA